MNLRNCKSIKDPLQYGHREHSFENAAEKFGYRCSGLFQDFLIWIIEDCKKNEIKKLYFFAREGEFFNSILNSISIAPPMEHCVLCVSRISTFLPSLHTYDMKDWNRFLNQYSDQNIAAFICSLGIPYKTALALLEQVGLKAEDAICSHIESFQKGVMSKEFQSFVREESVQTALMLRRYLKQKGIDETSDKVAIVDIGWRGTIQDNLCYVMPNTEFYGYYLGLIPFLNDQPENAIKKGYLNAYPMSNALLKSHTQLEMICGSKNGSTLGYAVISGNQVQPIKEFCQQDSFSWGNYTKHFQKGVLRGCAAQKRKICSLYKSILLLTLFPDKNMSKAFFKYRYSEKFGLGQNLDLSQLEFNSKVFLQFKNIKKAYALRNYLNNTKWPQGFLRIHHLSFLIPFYNAILIFESCIKSKVVKS